jgi:hypothetical protein
LLIRRRAGCTIYTRLLGLLHLLLQRSIDIDRELPRDSADFG